MAILETTIKRFLGTSTEEKPYPGLITADGHEITENDMPAGSTFLVKDPNTGVTELFHWTGRDWLSGESPELHELRAIKGLLGDLVDAMSVAL